MNPSATSPDLDAADADFLAQIEARIPTLGTSEEQDRLSYVLWRPRFKKWGKNFSRLEWIHTRDEWARELTLSTESTPRFPLWYAAFLELLLEERITDLWPRLRKLANSDFKIHYEAEPRRVSSRLHDLRLPKLGETTWQITVKEGVSFSGPVVVFNLRAWEILDSTLVD